MENKYTIAGTGGILIGVGISKIDTNLTVGLGLVGVGVLLQILVAVLQKYGVNIQSTPQD